MVETAAPFATPVRLEASGLRVEEIRGRTLVQVSGLVPAEAERALIGLLGARALPPHEIVAGQGIELLRLAPTRWLAMTQGGAIEERLTSALGPAAAVLDVTHAFAILRLEGPLVRDALSEVCPLDFDARRFAAGRGERSTFFGQTHATYIARGEHSFELHLPRSFARSAVGDLEATLRGVAATAALSGSAGSSPGRGARA